MNTGFRLNSSSLLLRAPGDVVGPRSRAVFVHQLLHHFTRVVQFVEVVLEDVLFTELLQEGLTLPEFVVLPACSLKQGRDACVVGHHQAADSVGRG